MSDQVRALVFPTKESLGSIGQAVEAALEAWGADWIPRSLIRIHVECVAELPSGDSFEHWRSDLGNVWIRSDRSDEAALRTAVLGGASTRAEMPVQDWGDEIVERACGDRNHAVCGALLSDLRPEISSVSSAAIPRSLAGTGSGAVRMSCEAIGLQAIADGAIWHSRTPLEREAVEHQQLVGVAPLAMALGQSSIQIDVLLGAAKVELTKLLNLRNGDVLRLPKKLDESLTVLCEGQAFASAVLGESNGRKSVQLVTLHDEQPGTER